MNDSHKPIVQAGKSFLPHNRSLPEAVQANGWPSPDDCSLPEVWNKDESRKPTPNRAICKLRPRTFSVSVEVVVLSIAAIVWGSVAAAIYHSLPRTAIKFCVAGMGRTSGYFSCISTNPHLEEYGPRFRGMERHKITSPNTDYPIKRRKCYQGICLEPINQLMPCFK